MSNYVKQLHAHLANYKATHLGALEPGVFRDSGRRYDHILPEDQKWLNILEPFRTDIQRHVERARTIALHRNFHHLNSSQAFAFNLFFPYFENGGALPLLAALGSPGELSSWELESIVDVEEGTNVDVTWLSGGVRTYCEVKLSEQEFGTAVDDERHREKLKKIYLPVLANSFSREYLEPKPFFQSYQLFRNVWLVAREPNSRLVFLLPGANARIWRQVSEFLALLSEPIAARVRAVAVEDVVDALVAADELPTNLRRYAELLREKYVPPTAA